MKLNPKNWRHWLYFGITMVNAFLALVVARFLPQEQTIILHGHRFNGNLIAFYDYLSRNRKELAVYYLTMDPAYFKKKQAQKLPVLYTENLAHMLKVARSAVIITTHGLHGFQLFKYLGKMKFVDVWHGIPFKRFDKKSFTQQKEYDAVWVSSPKLKKIYIDQFGFPANIVKATGYARVDRFHKVGSRKKLLEKYLIPGGYKKYVLFAPTWAHKPGKSIFPFGLSADKFFEPIDQLMEKLNSLAIFRTHLNTAKFPKGKFKHIAFMPYAQYEHAEDFLEIADVLVTDWSSIAFDYLPLRRPTIFLDVPPTFGGFTLGPEYRFGAIAKNSTQLLDVLKDAILKPIRFNNIHGRSMDRVSKEVYANTLDGKAAARYYANLVQLLESDS